MVETGYIRRDRMSYIDPSFYPCNVLQLIEEFASEQVICTTNFRIWSDSVCEEIQLL
jgi:hypothetical protein